MAGIYVLRNGGVAISTAITILQIKAGASNPVDVIRASVYQMTSETSTEEWIRWERKSAAATVTIAVAGTNLNKLNTDAPTSTLSLGTSATGFTASAEGTPSDIVGDHAFNILNGYLWVPVPEERIRIPAGGILGMKFGGAPASQTWYAEIVLQEL